MLFAFLSYVLFHDETPHQYTSINGLHKSNTWFSGLIGIYQVILNRKCHLAGLRDK